MKAIAIALLSLLAFSAVAVAANEPPPPSSMGEVPVMAPPDTDSKVILTWDQFVKITGYDAAKGGNQKLTIPWEEVEKLLGVKVENVTGKTTVDLPWEEFKALLEWSANRKGKDDTPPPADYIVSSSRYVGELTDDGGTFSLQLKLNILRQKGWKRIPVLPNLVALTDVTLPEGVFLNSSSECNAYELLTQASGPVEATLKFAVGVTKSAGVNQVNFPRVAVGASIVDLSINRKDVDVTVAGSQSLAKTSDDKATHVAAAVASGVPVAVSWERALPKVEAAPTKLYAETQTLVAVADQMLLCTETVNFNILHTAVRQLKLHVPKGVSVLTVTGGNLQDWRVEGEEMQLVLRTEALGPLSLRVTYEAPAGQAAEAPVLRAVGVEREKGFIGVIALSNVEIQAGQVQGASALDVRRLPADIPAMTNQPLLLGFRYVGETFKIPLTIKKHEEVPVLVTIADTGLFTGMQLNDGRRMTKVVYSVRNNRNQFLRVRLPEGVEIWSVSVGGNTVAPAKDTEGSILIPLIRSSQNSQELASFPVEMVYVEAPAQAAPAGGTLTVQLPELNVPLMHLMYNYYLPAEGKYTPGAFGGGGGFSGPLRVVKEFTALATGAGAEVIQANAAAQVEQMAQQVQTRVDTEARAAGVSPIRVRLPVDGTLFKLEKILVLPGEKLSFTLKYTGWQPAK